MLEAEILDTNGMLEADIGEARATKELFYVTINQEVTLADKTSTEIFEATRAGKYAVGVYYNNDTFNIVPFVVIEENIAQCQILFDTDVVQISIDNTGAVTVRNISLAETSDIPQYTSQLTNNSGYITNAVSDLANYYLKSETYTKDEVQQLIAQIPSLNVVVVQELPASGEALTIYLVPKDPSQTNNYYDEYMWLTSGWEKIGDTQIDLTDYVKFTDYASYDKGGVVRTSSSNGTNITASGFLQASERTYAQYQNDVNNLIVGKGTLENVITGKQLVNQTTLNNEIATIEEEQTIQDNNISKNSLLGNLFTKYNGETTEVSINNTAETPLKIGLKGNTYQYSTTGKNLIDFTTISYGPANNATVTRSGGEYTVVNSSSQWGSVRFLQTNLQLKTNTTYTFSATVKSTTSTIGSRLYASSGINNTSNELWSSYVTTGQRAILTFTTPSTFGTTTLLAMYPNEANATAVFTDIMIEESSTANSYEPYTNGASPNPDYPQDIQVVTGENTITIENQDSSESQNYPISLGNIELCESKTGDYQDYIHKSENKWYVHKEIGKVVLNGSEADWAIYSSSSSKTSFRHDITNIESYTNANAIPNVFSNRFKPASYNATWVIGNISRVTSVSSRITLTMEANLSLDNFKTWLSTHNTTVYYVLETPTETEITDSTLISQLDNLQNAMCYEEQTNINQVNDDMPFWLDYETFKPITDINSYGGVMMPSTLNMTPIKTIEYDVSSTSYYKVMSAPNTYNSVDDVKGTALFRATITGATMGIQTIEGYFELRQASNLMPYLVIKNNPGSGYENTATIGARYVRYVIPKNWKNGYNWDIEFSNINNNARHIKLEIFSTPDEFIWYDTYTTSTYNTTYQSAGTITASTTDGLNAIGTYNMTVQAATTSNYITSYLPKYPSGTLQKAGSAILAQQFVYMNNKVFYPSSDKTKAIEPGFGIHLCSNAVNANSAPASTAIRQKYNNATLTNIPHDTLTAGDPCYFRCTMSNGNILSDDYVATSMTPGYTWYYVGVATSADAINTDTTQSVFYTLNENGKLTHINGLEIA